MTNALKATGVLLDPEEGVGEPGDLDQAIADVLGWRRVNFGDDLVEAAQQGLVKYRCDRFGAPRRRARFPDDAHPGA